VVGAIRTIASMAERIAGATAQQGGAASEIRDRSERIHHLGGDNLTRIGEGRVQGEQLLQLGGHGGAGVSRGLAAPRVGRQHPLTLCATRSPGVRRRTWV